MDRRKFIGRLGAWSAGITLANFAFDEDLYSADVSPDLGRIGYQLSWIKNFQFAGEYIAEDRKYYEQLGLQVDLISGGPNTSADPIVAAGKALVGQSSPDFMSNAIDKGADLKCIGANYRKTIFCMISMARTPLHDPSEMLGKKIGIQTVNLVVWHAFLKLNKIDLAQIDTIPVQFDFTPLVSGEVDGFFGFLNDDVIQLQQHGHDVVFFPLSDFGYKMFTCTYSVAAASLENKTKRAQLVAFMKAEIKGWQDAIKDPALGARLTVDVYGKGNGLDFESQKASCMITNGIMTDAVTERHGLFWMSPQEVQETIATLAAAQVKATPDMFTNEIIEEAYAGKTIL
jgi:ABC-type nitrate/sulfonate/bicarbonate transport system substrate-binding protein